MSDALKLVDEAMSKLSAVESELETALERLNPVIQRGERALVATQLANLRDGVRELERRRSRVTSEGAGIEADSRAIARLEQAIAELGTVTGKGVKNEKIVAAVGSAVGAAKSVLSAV